MANPAARDTREENSPSPTSPPSPVKKIPKKRKKSNYQRNNDNCKSEGQTRGFSDSGSSLGKEELEANSDAPWRKKEDTKRKSGKKKRTETKQDSDGGSIVDAESGEYDNHSDSPDKITTTTKKRRGADLPKLLPSLDRNELKQILKTRFEIFFLKKRNISVQDFVAAEGERVSLAKMISGGFEHREDVGIRWNLCEWEEYVQLNVSMIERKLQRIISENVETSEQTTYEEPAPTEQQHHSGYESPLSPRNLLQKKRGRNNIKKRKKSAEEGDRYPSVLGENPLKRDREEGNVNDALSKETMKERHEENKQDENYNISRGTREKKQKKEKVDVKELNLDDENNNYKRPRSYSSDLDVSAPQFFPPNPIGGSNDPHDFGVDVDGMDPIERSAYLSSLPIELKNHFRQPFFLRYGKMWWPVLVMSPLDVNATTRDLFDKAWARTKGNLNKAKYIIYYYGVPLDCAGQAYALVPWKDLLNYDEGIERKLHFDAPCVKKHHQEKKMTKYELMMFEGFKQIQEDALKIPQEKIAWMFEHKIVLIPQQQLQPEFQSEQDSEVESQKQLQHDSITESMEKSAKKGKKKIKVKKQQQSELQNIDNTKKGKKRLKEKKITENKFAEMDTEEQEDQQNVRKMRKQGNKKQREKRSRAKIMEEHPVSDEGEMIQQQDVEKYSESDEEMNKYQQDVTSKKSETLVEDDNEVIEEEMEQLQEHQKQEEEVQADLKKLHDEVDEEYIENDDKINKRRKKSKKKSKKLKSGKKRMVSEERVMLIDSDNEQEEMGIEVLKSRTKKKSKKENKKDCDEERASRSLDEDEAKKRTKNRRKLRKEDYKIEDSDAENEIGSYSPPLPAFTSREQSSPEEKKKLQRGRSKIKKTKADSIVEGEKDSLDVIAKQENHEGENVNQEEDCSLENLQEQRRFDLNVKEILPIVINLRGAISNRDFEKSMEFMNKLSHEIQNMSYHFVVHFEVGHLITSRIKDTFPHRKNIVILSRKMKNECKRMLAEQRKVLPQGFKPIVKEGITDQSLEDEEGENNDGSLERSTTMQSEARSRPPRPPPPVRRISPPPPSKSLACHASKRRSADDTDAIRREDRENEEEKEDEEDEAEEKTEVEEENDVEEENEDEYREKLDWVRGTYLEIQKATQLWSNEEENEVQEEHDVEEEDEDEEKNEEGVEDKKESKNEEESEDEKEHEEESDDEEEDGGREEDREKEEDGDEEEDGGAAPRGAGTGVPTTTAPVAPTPIRARPRASVAPAAAPPASHIAGLDAWMRGVDPALHRTARVWFHEQRLCSVGALAELGDDGTEMIVEALGVKDMLVEKLLRKRLTRLPDV